MNQRYLERMKELFEDLFNENRKDFSFPPSDMAKAAFFILFSLHESVPFFVSVVSAAIKYDISVNVTGSEVLKESFDHLLEGIIVSSMPLIQITVKVQRVE